LLGSGETLRAAYDRGVIHHQRLQLLAQIGHALALRPRKKIRNLRLGHELGIDRQRRQVARTAELQHVSAGAATEHDEIDQ
jgi:hypothetical protein